MTTETRTFVGLDGYAGFRRGQTYTVEVIKEDDGTGERAARAGLAVAE